MIPKVFDEIGKDDIDALVAEKERESKTLEYKQELPHRTERAKKEFLADVSSFANASGGGIIYGIEAEVDANGNKTGAPKKVAPLTGAGADEAKLWLENVIRTGVEPRMRVQIKDISGWDPDGEGFVLLVRVPKSFASPHMVKETYRFYSRNSAGKYPLDVQEIRSAFLATESQAERIKRFRYDRLAQIVADETPVPLAAPDRLVLHLVPLAPFLNNDRLELSDKAALRTAFRPLDRSGSDHARYNLDGLLTQSARHNDGTCHCYCQLFFHGAVETVRSEVLTGSPSHKFLYVKYEDALVEAVESYLKGYAKLGVDGPLSVMVSLLGCKGAYLRTKDPTLDLEYGSPIDREAAVLPDVQFDGMKVNVEHEMKPVFDAVANSCGRAASPSYANDGTRNA